MFTLNQNAAFQDKVNQGDQLILDNNNEQIVVNIPSRPIPSSNSITVPLSVTDTSPLSIEIVSVWVRDLSITSSPNYGRTVTAIALQPGQTESTSVIVNVKITNAKITDQFTALAYHSQRKQRNHNLTQNNMQREKTNLKQNLRHRKRFLADHKGYSEIVGAIFMVLIALFLFFNVFMFVLDRNTAFQIML